jgi:hypothetical protein
LGSIKSATSQSNKPFISEGKLQSAAEFTAMRVGT